MKKLKKLYTILLCVSVLIVVGCKAEPETDTFGLGDEEFSTVLTGLLLNTGFTDLQDGTVLDKPANLIWQKCSAGQVYRSAENDCRGKQSPSLFTAVDATKWGAAQLAYCNSNTYACNALSAPPELIPNGSINPGIQVNGTSEAYEYCKSLNNASGFPGYRVPNPYELQRLTFGGRTAMLALFPDTQEALYWSSWSRLDDLTGETAVAVDFDRSGLGEEKAIVKVDRNYVRCVRPSVPVSNP
ncbi:Lcl domain-containing protein [Leptospira sp. GIMC2001]|uniref:Lcl domain-containing protein n=1 Tax=Leptospira sp. GIMC2001 TaxID=1513297 RepID=UPI002349466B|nr:DUF1566 domain-containing protein [Leptospira sp. GIMC2001]WCL49024.1 DUF1566 domain-containing protein [Leptospira sp. GIMC2001]